MKPLIIPAAAAIAVLVAGCHSTRDNDTAARSYTSTPTVQPEPTVKLTPTSRANEDRRVYSSTIAVVTWYENGKASSQVIDATNNDPISNAGGTGD